MLGKFINLMFKNTELKINKFYQTTCLCKLVYVNWQASLKVLKLQHFNR